MSSKRQNIRKLRQAQTANLLEGGHSHGVSKKNRRARRGVVDWSGCFPHRHPIGSNWYVWSSNDFGMFGKRFQRKGRPTLYLFFWLGQHVAWASWDLSEAQSQVSKMPAVGTEMKTLDPHKLWIIWHRHSVGRINFNPIWSELTHFACGNQSANFRNPCSMYQSKYFTHVNVGTKFGLWRQTHT